MPDRTRFVVQIAALGVALFGTTIGGCLSAGIESVPDLSPGPDLGLVDDGCSNLPVLGGDCAPFVAQGSLGKLPAAELSEISGIAVSRKNPKVLWMHNDSGDSARVFAVSIATPGTPKLLATYRLTGVTADDWEDIEIGPVPGKSGDFLYIGDIGDNFNRVPQRTSIQIYRIPEPTVDTTKTGQVIDVAGAERIDLVYPGGKTYDSEALLVDPQSGEIVLLTKNYLGASYLFRTPPVATPSGTITLAGATDCGGTLRPLNFAENATPIITGADISASGDTIAVRAYGGLYEWTRSAGSSIADTLRRQPCQLPMANENQGESVALTPDGSGYYTISEGVNPDVYYFGKR